MDLHREAERLLWRYVVEIVERFDLCPWARRARERGEIGVEIVDDPADAGAAVERILATPGKVMGMVVLPRAPLSPAHLRRLRDELLAARAGRTPTAGIADFHPDAALDLSTPARAVAGLRAAPFPTLQVVRLDVLAAARATAPPPDRSAQASILADLSAPPPRPTSDRIADTNLATARDDPEAIAQAIASIHADRDAVTASCR